MDNSNLKEMYEKKRRKHFADGGNVDGFIPDSEFTPDNEDPSITVGRQLAGGVQNGLRDLESGPATQKAPMEGVTPEQDPFTDTIGAAAGTKLAEGAGEILGNEIGSIGYKVPLSNGLEAKVLKNPSPQQAGRLAQNSKDGALRYFADPDGNLHMWDAFDLSHGDIIDHLGLNDAPEVYAGAGTAHSTKDAQDIAKRFLSDNKPPKPTTTLPPLQIQKDAETGTFNIINTDTGEIHLSPKGGRLAGYETRRDAGNILSLLTRSKTGYADGGDVVKHYAEGDVVSSAQAVPTPQPSDTPPGFIPDAQFVPDPEPSSGSGAPTQVADSDIAPSQQPGFIPDHEFQSDEDKYTTPSQQMLAGLEGASQGFAGPLASGLEVATGLSTPEDMRARQQYNPALHTVSKLGAFTVSSLFGVGEARLLAAAGDAALAKVGLTTASTLLPKVAAGAIRGATELGILSAGDEITRAIVQDPTTSSTIALTDVGLNAALGLVGGGALGGLGHFLLDGGGKGVVQEMQNFSGQMKYRTNVPDPATDMTEEQAAFYNEIKGAYDETYGVSGTKAQAIAKSLPPTLTDAMLGQAQDVADQVGAQIEKMRASPNRYPARFVEKLQSDLDDFNGRVFPKSDAPAPISDADQFTAQNEKLAGGATPDFTPPDQVMHTNPNTPESVFNAIQGMKQMAQGYAKYGKFVKPIDDAYDFVQAMRPLGSDLKEGLEDSDTWGNAGKLQQNINSNFVKFKPFLERYEKLFTDQLPDPETGEIHQVVSANRMQNFVNQAGTLKDGVKKVILKGFLDNGEKFADALDDAYQSIGQESPFTRSPLNVSRRALEELTPGMKIANAFVDKGLGKGAANTLAAGAGSAVGGALFSGYGALGGAYVGKEALGPMLEKVLPVAGKAVFEKIANWRALRAAGRIIKSAVDGSKNMSVAAKNMWKSGVEVLPTSLVPSVTAIKQLNTRLVAAQNNPAAFTQGVTNNPAGQLLPNHVAAQAQTLGNAVQYINGQRPQTSPQAPLDQDREPSSVKTAAFQNLLQIAQQPLTVMSKIKQGTLTPDDVKHVTALYPAAWDQMKAEMGSALAAHVAKNGVGSVPYKTRIGYSLATGQAMDSTLTGASIMAAQPQPSPSPQSPGQPKSSTSGKHTTSGLNKIGQQAATPGQARQQSQQQSDDR